MLNRASSARHGGHRALVNTQNSHGDATLTPLAREANKLKHPGDWMMVIGAPAFHS